MIQREFALLGSLAPETVEKTHTQFLKRYTEENTLQLFQQLPAADQEKAILASLENLSKEKDAPSEIQEIFSATNPEYKANFAKRISILFQSMDGISSAQQRMTAFRNGINIGRRLDVIADSTEVAKSSNALIKFADFCERKGILGSFVTGASLAGVAFGLGKGPQTAQDYLTIANSALSAGGTASDLAKLFGKGNLEAYGQGLKNFDKLTEAGKFLKVMEFAGPMADAISSGMDAYNSYQDFKSGDTVGGVSKAVSSASGVAATVAGIAIVAGSSGPLAPAVLLGATVVGLASWAADAWWGETDEESFLKRGISIDGQEQNFWKD